jgi:hypothetical protein
VGDYGSVIAPLFPHLMEVVLASRGTTTPLSPSPYNDYERGSKR